LTEYEAGAKCADLCRKHGMSEGTFYAWKAKFGGMTVSDAKRLKVDLSRFEAAPLITFTATKEITMGLKRTDEFRQDAVRIALTNGLMRISELPDSDFAKSRTAISVITGQFGRG
jgi:transposase-like protein